jgi:hypothetical protein
VIGLTVASGQTASAVFAWNTTSAREGLHALTPTVTDSTGKTTQGSTTNLLVDNAAPGAPTAPGVNMPDGSSAQVWWTASYDGTDVNGTTPLLASHYLLSAWQQPSSTTAASNYALWTSLTSLTQEVVTAPTSGAPLTLSGLAGFNRFAFAVQASSPDRGSSSGLLSSPVVLTGITHPTLSGLWTATLSGKKYTVVVALSIPVGPGFPWTGTATTKFYRLTTSTQLVTSGTLLGTVSSSYPTWSNVTGSDTQTTGNNGTPTAYWYGAVTTLTPQGYGASATTVQSSVIGPPANMTASGAQGMVFTRW